MRPQIPAREVDVSPRRGRFLQGVRCNTCGGAACCEHCCAGHHGGHDTSAADHGAAHRRDSFCILGYVDVSTDEMTRRLGRQDVLVSFRGTVTPAEWLANLMSSLEPARLDPCDPRPDVKVESGFLSIYTSADKTCRFGGAGSCREQLLREITLLLADSSSEATSITLAGHSMGGALALLLAYDLAELGLNRAAPVTVFSFGGPRVGNAAFKARCDELGVKALRVANVRDPVMRMPGVFLNEATTGTSMLRPWRESCYTHVGVELPLDVLSSVGELAAVHDLGTYIALLRKPKAAAKADDQERVPHDAAHPAAVPMHKVNFDARNEQPATSGQQRLRAAARFSHNLSPMLLVRPAARNCTTTTSSSRISTQ